MNFIYPTEDTVTNERNKLNYYINQLSFMLIHFNNLYSSDYTYDLRTSCLLITCMVQVDLNFSRPKNAFSEVVCFCQMFFVKIWP